MFDNSKVTDISPMVPALRKEKCKLVSIKKNDDGSFTFAFTDAISSLNHREFAPKQGQTQTQEQFETSVKLLTSRIAHITRAFVTEAEFLKIKGNGNSLDEKWNDYMKQTMIALGVDRATGKVAKAAGVDVALKVVYRENKGKYYSALPQVPPFISTANHPKEFTENPAYDKFVIPKITPDHEDPTFSGGATVPKAAGEFTPTPAAATDNSSDW